MPVAAIDKDGDAARAEDDISLAAHQESQYLSKTMDAQDLADAAQEALRLGDPIGASIRLRAAKLASSSKPLFGIGMLTQAVEDALDQHVAARKAALDEHTQDRLAFVDAAAERMAAQRDASALLGEASGAALASIGEKLTRRSAAQARGEQYQEVG
jgi:hypothetical protein